MTHDIKPVNRRIAGYRKLAGYTQEQAAELLGLKRNTYARIERHGNPPTQLIEKMSELYKVPVQNFFYDNPIDFRQTQPINEPMTLRKPDYFESSDILPLSPKEAGIIRILRALPKDKGDSVLEYINDVYKNRNSK